MNACANGLLIEKYDSACGHVCRLVVRAGAVVTCFDNPVELADVVQLDMVVESDARLCMVLSMPEKDDSKINLQVHARGSCILLVSSFFAGRASCAINVVLAHESAHALVRFIALLKNEAMLTHTLTHACTAPTVRSDIYVAAFVAPRARAAIHAEVNVLASARRARVKVQMDALLADAQAHAVVHPHFTIQPADISLSHGALIASPVVLETCYLRMYGLNEAHACALLWSGRLLDRLTFLLSRHEYAAVVARVQAMLGDWHLQNN